MVFGSSTDFESKTASSVKMSVGKNANHVITQNKQRK